MKRRRYIAWMLMVVSIIMLTASVFPHHHHHERICLQHDVAECHCENVAYHHQDCASESGHVCHDGCVTKFRSISPDEAQVNVAPFYTFCSLLYSAADVLALACRWTEPRSPLFYSYVERLHPACHPQAKGLRAPPVA